MRNRYLLLGASSDLCCAFLRSHNWSTEDKIIAQYYQHKEQLESIRCEIAAPMELWPADFCDEESTLHFADKLGECCYVPTHILHVPAIPVGNLRFTEMEWKDTQKQIDVQCRSLWVILQTVIKEMAKTRHGKIVIGLSSYSINVPPKFLAGYVTSKYALMGMGKALAVEYASKGIQVNMVSPSMMETKFIRNIHDSVVKKSADDNPCKRNSRPADVASVIEYLFSENNTFITGTNIPVTGGEEF